MVHLQITSKSTETPFAEDTQSESFWVIEISNKQEGNLQ